MGWVGCSPWADQDRCLEESSTRQHGVYAASWCQVVVRVGSCQVMPAMHGSHAAEFLPHMRCHWQLMYGMGH